MSLIPMPSNIAIGNSVSSSDIEYIYTWLTQGIYDLYVNAIETNRIYSESGTGYLAQGYDLSGTALPYFLSDPIDRTKNSVDTVMQSISLSPTSAHEGKMMFIRWQRGNPVINCSILTACMKTGNSYTWVFNENLLTEY